MDQLDEKTETDLAPPDAPDNFTTIPAAAPTLAPEPGALVAPVAPVLPKAPKLPRELLYEDL